MSILTPVPAPISQLNPRPQPCILTSGDNQYRGRIPTEVMVLDRVTVDLDTPHEFISQPPVPRAAAIERPLVGRRWIQCWAFGPSMPVPLVPPR